MHKNPRNSIIQFAKRYSMAQTKWCKCNSQTQIIIIIAGQVPSKRNGRTHKAHTHNTHVSMGVGFRVSAKRINSHFSSGPATMKLLINNFVFDFLSFILEVFRFSRSLSPNLRCFWRPIQHLNAHLSHTTSVPISICVCVCANRDRCTPDC